MAAMEEMEVMVAMELLVVHIRFGLGLGSDSGRPTIRDQARIVSFQSLLRRAGGDLVRPSRVRAMSDSGEGNKVISHGKKRGKK